MTALVEDARPGAAPTPGLDPLTAARYGTAAAPANPASEAGNYSKVGDMIAARMPDLVKGAGFAHKGGNTPLTSQGDILTRAAQASLSLRMETEQGFRNKSSVVKSFNPGFLSNFGALQTALSMPSVGEQLAQFMGAVASPDVVRSFTASNMGLGTVSGLTPFNLLAPSRLIYPVYTLN